MIKKIASIIAITVVGNAFSQITVDNTLTPEELVEQVLIGSGVTPTNITVGGSAANAQTIQVSASSFDQNGTTFDIEEGVLLSTGQGSVAEGPNSAGSSSNGTGTMTVNDTDMDAIELSGEGTTNGIILEFDFVATGNELEFNYIFGSEEYEEFAPPNSSSFNDVFGFFLSGPGITGPYSNGAVNLAEVPSSGDPVSINNVNPITNAAYYQSNLGGSYYGTAIEYDGNTVLMTAFSELECGETYHIKFGIANVGDQFWDSGVFLQGGSFTVNPVGFQFDTYTENNIIYESCEQLGVLMFTREGCNVDLGDPLTAYITYGGTAENGVDYEELEDSVYFAPGEDTIYWDIIPIEDLLAEGVESIDITLATINEFGDTIYGEGTFYISDNPAVYSIADDTTLVCYQDSVEISGQGIGGVGDLNYEWTHNGDTTTSTTVYAGYVNDTTDYYFVVTDECGTTVEDTATVIVNQTIAIDSILSGPATCDPIGWVSAYTSGGSTPTNVTFDWTYQEDTTITFPDQSALSELSSGWYYLTYTDENISCSVEDSVFVDVEDVPMAQLSASITSGCSPLDVSFDNSSENATSYVWNMGNGNTFSTGNTNSVNETYSNDASVYLVASNGDPNCNDTAYVYIDIVPCGCTDPDALNYDPDAVISVQEMCEYPTPEVTPPNVFTPNGDEDNDFFFLKTKHAESIEFTILNRWGNVVFEASGDQANPPFWTGKNKNGAKVKDGVYFYRYKVTGVTGEALEGHGFVEVVR